MHWAHWVKLEKPLDEDRLLMAKDIDKLIAVAHAAQDFLKESHDKQSNMTCYLGTQYNLEKALEDLEKE